MRAEQSPVKSPEEWMRHRCSPVPIGLSVLSLIGCERPVEQSCVATLGQAAEWAPGESSLRWEGDSLRTGLGGAR
jgi:hypothetical protein